jgi:hypothetical protein
VLQSFDPVVALGDSVLNQGGLEPTFVGVPHSFAPFANEWVTSHRCWRSVTVQEQAFRLSSSL